MKLTPHGGRKPALFVFAVLAVAAAFAAPAQAASRTFHVGDASALVCGSKWEISGPHGHRPNIFTVRGTYTRPLRPKCNYAGKAWGRAIVAYKYRLGYPTKLLKPVAGQYFFKLLRGPRDQRPLLWIALAQRRAKAIKPGPTKLALKIVAWERLQIGTHETCGGYCNRGSLKGPGGYSVDALERMAGLLGQQWCGILQWDAFKLNGVIFAPPPYNPFYVPSIGQWALNHGYALYKGKRVYKATITGTARVGSLVSFLKGPSALDGHHVGIVSSINRHGYYTIEGNSGDAVRSHWYPWGSALRVFINVPGVA